MQGKLINQFMNEKAGMSAVDKNSIAQTIQRLTAGTPKAIHEQQMQQKRALEAAEMLRKCLGYSYQQREQLKTDWWETINELKKQRTLNRYWAHFDFDMFYIAVELLDRPEMKDKPCAVGSKNSVLSTANYQARKYGLRAAMPTFIAVQLCPEVHLFEPSFIKYKHYSNIFREILSTYDPDLESNGLDQAYIDMTEHLLGKNQQEIEQFVWQIRNKIYKATGLTVSCGVGANKMLAKMASQQRKPDNQFVLANQSRQIEKFMSQKKLRKIPGIGPVNEYFLKQLGMETAQDVLNNLDVISICFSKLSCDFFVQAALGLGSIEHQFRQRKSVGKSQTFKATDDKKFLEQRLMDLCEQVSQQLQQLGFISLNVVLSYQTHNFQKRDKTFNLPKYTDQAQQLFTTVLSFQQSIKDKLRLLGVKCNSLVKVEEFKRQQLMTYINNPKKLHENAEEQKNSVAHIKSLMRTDIVDKGRFLCPICNQHVQCKGNISLFNKHVDKCLNQLSGDGNQAQQPASTTATALKEQKTEVKQTSGVASKQNSAISSMLGKKQKPKGGTLDSFFKK